jgi:hypothetical protein
LKNSLLAKKINQQRKQMTTGKLENQISNQKNVNNLANFLAKEIRINKLPLQK